MNVSCIICSDILTPTADIYTTTCGHLFHYTCLIQWIERSSTCPQCRCKATEKTIHRVYFNLANADGITEDVVTLQYKIDNLNFQIKLKDKDVQIYKDKKQKMKDQNMVLRHEIKELENKQSVNESVMHALKEQVSYFKLKAKETTKLSDEVIRLKDKLKELEHVQLVLTGSKEQVNDMLRHNKDPQSLGLLVYTLKKELMEADRKYRLLNCNMKHLQNDLGEYRHKNCEILRENTKLMHDIECHQNCDGEKHYLKKKISDLERKLKNMHEMRDTSSDHLNRVIMESPAPRNKFLDINATLETVNSPTINERVQSIKDSESPYLTIKSSNVGLSCLVNPKYTIFKNQNPASENINATRGDYCYDGLGGHTKDIRFPEPKNIGLKRTKSATVSSSKFRKLAPNKKISNYFVNTDD